MKKKEITLIALIIIFLSGCGIKGAPTPPQTPFFIGNGKKEIEIKKSQTVLDEEKQKEERKKRERKL